MLSANLNFLFGHQAFGELAGGPSLAVAKGSLESVVAPYLRFTTDPFFEVAPRAVLVGDAHPRAHFSRGDDYLELRQQLESRFPTLYIAPSDLALDRGGLPGEGTLYCPKFPSLHLKAIVSSQYLASFSLEPVWVALAHGVKAVFLTASENEQSRWCEALGVPVVVSRDPRQMAARVCFFWENYPDLGLTAGVCNRTDKASSPTLSRATQSATPPFTVCSITDSHYLPFFLGFLENVHEASQGNFKCFVLGLDDKVRQSLRKTKRLPYLDIVELKDLWTPDELGVIESRRVGFRAFSSKARLIRRALGLVGGPVFYCDSDVYFFQPTQSLEKTLGEKDHLVLFPHLNDEYPCAQLDGLFNAGMLGVRPGAEAFLDWWSDLCFRECEWNRERGVVGDQAYLNLAPVMFEKVKIYQGHDHNVARWNSRTLGLKWQPSEVPTIAENLPVSTYHAAFCDDSGVFEKKFVWDMLASFFSPGYELKSSVVLSENLKLQQKRYWKHLEHVSKLQSLFKRIPFLLGSKRTSVGPLFWFSDRGRRWLSVLVWSHRFLHALHGTASFFRSRLRKRFRPKVQDRSSLPSNTNSEHWVESNRKAMGC